MSAWMVVLAAGAASYLLRISMISAPDQIRLPARLEDSGRLVAPAAFAALAMTSLVAAMVDAGGLQAAPPVMAAAVAVLAVLRTGRTYAAVLAGLPAFWTLSAIVPA